MRYFDAEGNEIAYEEVDLSLGHLEPFQIVVAHHDEVEMVPERYHYELKNVYFEEGHCVADLDPNDPRIVVINDQTGEFDFNDERGYHVRHCDVRKVYDQVYIPYQEAYDEYEDAEKYILYTEEELAAIAEQKEIEAKKENFLEIGYQRLDDMAVNIDDLTLAIADLMGV